MKSILLILSWLASLGIAAASNVFLGPIPVQFVNAGEELLLDMRRFYEPGENSRLKVAGGTFDPATSQLRVKVEAGQRGVIDLPIEVSAGERTLHGVLTLAVQGPLSNKTSARAPFVYADRRTGTGLEIAIINGDAKLGGVSAVVEEKDGQTRKIEPTIDGARLAFSTDAVPGDGWLRIIVADAHGNASNVLRFPLGEAATFHWQDAVMYYAFTDRFFDGDKSNDRPVKNPDVKPPANYHGGDWRGIRDKIEDGYFDELGINTLWIAPLNKNPDQAYREYPEPHRWYTGYHGYWPVSPTEVDPHFGDAVELKTLVKAAHNHGIKVLADLVLHHVHILHPWWKEHRDWFGKLELPDGRKNLRLWDEQQFTTWFEPFLPTFDFSKNAPVEALIDNSVWWADEYNLDGFRLDAVKHIPQAFWPRFRTVLRDRVPRPLYLVGETFKDRAGIDSFVGPNMLDGQFDFPLYDSIKEAFATEATGLENLDASLAQSERAFGKDTPMSPLLDNQDKPRFMAYADGDLPDPKIPKEEEVGWQKPPKVNDPKNYEKLDLAETFLLTIDGVPMIYYGDEIGMTGAGDPDNRRDMRFDGDLSSDEKSVLANFKKLTRIRREHPSLRYGSRRVVDLEKDTYAFVRAHLGDRVVCVFNRGRQDHSFELEVAPELADGNCVNLLDGTALRVEDGKLKLRLKARSAAIVARH